MDLGTILMDRVGTTLKKIPASSKHTCSANGHIVTSCHDNNVIFGAFSKAPQLRVESVYIQRMTRKHIQTEVQELSGFWLESYERFT
jgi:hypothetical protein